MKEGREYVYMSPPEHEQGKAPFLIDVSIPTREQVLRMAEQAHRGGVQWTGWVGEWPAYYVPAEDVFSKLVEIGHNFQPTVEPKKYTIEPRFEVGVMLVWKAYVHFRGGAAVFGENAENLVTVAGAQQWILPFGDDVQADRAQVGAESDPIACIPDKVLRAITERKGQASFRGKLLAAYGGRCAITDCDAEPALEAAHVLGYAETGSQAVTNGLLLRADIHTLFDTGHIRIDPETMMVVLSDALASTCYKELAGKRLMLPTRLEDRPNIEALRQRWEAGRIAARTS